MKLCDVEFKGNVCRLYFCADEEYNDVKGDDWDDKPASCNAGTVYDKYVVCTKDAYIDFDHSVLRAEDEWTYHYNEPYCKFDYKKRIAPVFIINYNNDEYCCEGYSYYLGAANSSEEFHKIYLGDSLEDILAVNGLNIFATNFPKDENENKDDCDCGCGVVKNGN